VSAPVGAQPTIVGTFLCGERTVGFSYQARVPIVANVAIPHFSYPFRFASPSAAVSEQDSLDEIADCVLSVLLCPSGFRVELPTFGLVDPTFAVPSPDLDQIRDVVDAWEPRAAAVLSEYPDLIDELIAHVEIDVSIRTEA
jgi:hypothetical protein